MNHRPHFQKSGEQLRELYAAHENDLAVLDALKAELAHRSTPKMQQLLREVEHRLAGLHGVGPVAQSTKSGLSTARQKDLFAQEASGRSQPHDGDGRGGDGANDVDDLAATALTESGPARNDLPPDDRRRPSKYTLIQHPGVGGRPSKYAPILSRDLVLDVPPNASNAKRFSAALDGLVAEMKAEGTGSRSLILNDGAATDLGTDGFGYVFDFVEAADIFEDAQVEVVAGNRRCSGSVVSILPGKIILSLDENLGPRIRMCVLKVDNTALLVALKDRLDEIDRKALNINTALADAVISPRDGDDGSAVLSIEVADDKLDPKQAEAVRKALQRKVFYIWGPPGTGKTHTLAALVGALFNAGKRVLICSNTNQAVDELLKKLCDRLTTDHPAVMEGKIIRQGRVEPERLGVYGEYLIIDRIVERLSRDLHQRRAALQTRLEHVEGSLAQVDGEIRRFEDRDRAAVLTTQMEADLAQRRKTRQRAQADLEGAIQKQANEERALAAWHQAGWLGRVLMPSEERLEQLLGAATRGVGELASLDRDSLPALDRVVAELATHLARVSALDRELATHDRVQLIATRDSVQGERTAIRDELARITAELEDIKRSLLANAKVIGTTVTRAYLSAKEFGAFDAVIVDEASMVLLPALYLVCGLARERVTISGDFNQLPPIVSSRQQAIVDAIGSDVFWTAGVTKACRNSQPDSRVTMLDIQRRMVQPVCDLIIEAMEYNGLKTDPCTETRQQGSAPPFPFDGPLTVIDSSRLWPFESRNLFSSRFNLMHTLLVRNLSWHLKRVGFVANENSLGVCTPYAAQAKLTSEMLKDEGLDLVTASTVHRFQGAERRMMLLDIPESIGSGFNIGQFIQADELNDAGAKLLNVAVSRTQDYLIILANLTYLDAKLPSHAKLRIYLHEMQRFGRVVDAHEVLALRPVTEDLRRYGDDPTIEWDADASGVFRQDGFDRLFQRDVTRAKKSVAIFSGFVTPQRVGAYGDLFRRKVLEGVAVRCVTRPPKNNGSMDPDETKRTLDSLEGIGVIVDTRWVIHEKVVIVDDETVWFGSLNPLSHTSRTDELMQRVVSKGWASKLASLLSITSTGAMDLEGLAVRKENPTHCGGRMCYLRGKWGPYFKCETCGHNQNLFRR